jgi:hypothetical protein
MYLLYFVTSQASSVLPYVEHSKRSELLTPFVTVIGVELTGASVHALYIL